MLKNWGAIKVKENSRVAVYLGIKRIISAPAMLMLAPMISH